MELFSKRQVFQMTPVATELDQAWFSAWAGQICTTAGFETLRQRWDATDAIDVMAQLFGKATAVMNLDLNTYVEKYCSSDAVQAYLDYLDTDDVTPWGMVSQAAGLNSANASEWQPFVVQAMKQKLERFAEIVMDPEITRTQS